MHNENAITLRKSHGWQTSEVTFASGAVLIAFDAFRGDLVGIDAAGAVYRQPRKGGARELVGRLPPVIDRSGPSAPRALVPMADGSVWVARAGRGELGGLFHMEGRRVDRLPGITGVALRAGLAYDDRSHAFYSATHHQPAGGDPAGWLTRIELASGRSTQLCGGLRRPSAVSRLGGHVVVADQAAETLSLVDVRWTKPVPAAIAHGLPGIDALAPAGPHAVYAASWDALARRSTVLHLVPGGGGRLLWSGDIRIRSIASDGERLYATGNDCPVIIVIPVQRWSA